MRNFFLQFSAGQDYNVNLERSNTSCSVDSDVQDEPNGIETLNKNERFGTTQNRVRRSSESGGGGDNGPDESDDDLISNSGSLSEDSDGDSFDDDPDVPSDQLLNKFNRFRNQEFWKKLEMIKLIKVTPRVPEYL